MTIIVATADVHAILTVLGRRDITYEKKKQTLNLENTELSFADLRGAHLMWVNLERTVLMNADFTGADLHEANLRMTKLFNVQFTDSDLRGADFKECDLEDASFAGANLTRADVRETDLSRTHNLTQEQVDKAIGDSTTKLPAHLRMPESWKNNL